MNEMETLLHGVQASSIGSLDLFALLDHSAVVLLIAVLAELIIPIPSSLRLSRLKPLLKVLAARVNRDNNSSSQKIFAGIMLPTVVLLTAWALTFLIHACTGFDNLLALFILPLLLDSRNTLDTVWKTSYLLRHDEKDQARTVIGHKLERECGKLSYMGISKACCEYAAMALSCNWFAVIVWYLIAGLEGAVIMQLIAIMDQAFSSKNYSQNQEFSSGIRRLEQFMLAPVAAILLLLSLISFSPVAALRGAIGGVDSHPAPMSGFIQGCLGGGCDLALGGPRCYQRTIVRLPRIGGERQPDASSPMQIARKIR
ncbi:MAG TPA: hypothetical protein DCL74_03940, partial [Succinivibrionaceae bacterium]|nr:hypothetical protein [Succinivibrionaceae bacterium]